MNFVAPDVEGVLPRTLLRQPLPHVEAYDRGHDVLVQQDPCTALTHFFSAGTGLFTSPSYSIMRLPSNLTFLSAAKNFFKSRLPVPTTTSLCLPARSNTKSLMWTPYNRSPNSSAIFTGSSPASS